MGGAENDLQGGPDKSDGDRWSGLFPKGRDAVALGDTEFDGGAAFGAIAGIGQAVQNVAAIFAQDVGFGWRSGRHGGSKK